MNLLPYFLIFAGALLRLVPHLPNFAPIGAVALFGAVYLKKRDALWVPILAMVASDFFIGFDSVVSRITVYGSFLIVGLIGLWVRNHKNLGTVLGGSLFGSVMFYLITNFAYFYPPVMYSHDLNGVVSSYFNALPFFRNTLLSDLFYVSVMFGVYDAVRIWANSRRSVVTKAGF